MPSPSSRALVLYMKPGCHLCADAAGLLARLGGELGFSFREVDITQDPVLYELYRDYIPVVALNTEAILFAPFGEAHVRAALAPARSEA